MGNGGSSDLCFCLAVIPTGSGQCAPEELESLPLTKFKVPTICGGLQSFSFDEACLYHDWCYKVVDIGKDCDKKINVCNDDFLDNMQDECNTSSGCFVSSCNGYAVAMRGVVDATVSHYRNQDDCDKSSGTSQRIHSPFFNKNLKGDDRLWGDVTLVSYYTSLEEWAVQTHEEFNGKVALYNRGTGRYLSARSDGATKMVSWIKDWELFTKNEIYSSDGVNRVTFKTFHNKYLSAQDPSVSQKSNVGDSEKFIIY